jgi:hypothetical protein
MSFLYAVLLNSLQKLIKLLLPLEYIDFFRFNLFGFSLLKVLNRGGLPEVRESLSLQSPLLFNNDHLFLKLLLQV